jgi:hypothetical protein
MRMAVRRWGWLAGMVSVCASPVVFAAEPVAEREAAAGKSEGPPIVLGLLADAGVPDGANGALALRPVPWLRLHLGGGHNTVSAGYRGGFTVLPWGVGPSFSVDVGHYREGDANSLVRDVVGTNRLLTPLFQRFGYTYANAQLGLELGRGSFQFFVHGGFSFLRATVHNAQRALDAGQATQTTAGATTVRIVQDPIVRAWIPSMKLGMVVYFGGGA